MDGFQTGILALTIAAFAVAFIVTLPIFIWFFGFIFALIS